MAVVQLSDVIQPEFFVQYSTENSMTSTALFRSGVLVPNPLMRAQLGDGGDTLNIRFWLDLVSPADPRGVGPAMLAHYFQIPEREVGTKAVPDPRTSVAVDVAALKAIEALPSSWLISRLVDDVPVGPS
jgi:hypothetical protein